MKTIQEEFGEQFRREFINHKFDPTTAQRLLDFLDSTVSLVEKRTVERIAERVRGMRGKGDTFNDHIFNGAIDAVLASLAKPVEGKSN